jgi:hypothetical protein
MYNDISASTDEALIHAGYQYHSSLCVWEKRMGPWTIHWQYGKKEPYPGYWIVIVSLELKDETVERKKAFGEKTLQNGTCPNNVYLIEQQLMHFDPREGVPF